MVIQIETQRRPIVPTYRPSLSHSLDLSLT
ncbi:hypothetical protein 101136BS1_012 [Escherichia phage vB_EcoP-101136BS1]|nr:hypothetical protein 101136BS1_012 [Escherichia phage vB_EcoP-101136BS1]